jgi:hypothetical protein
LSAGRVVPSVTTASQASLSDLTDTGAALTWTAAEDALPFPLNTTVYRYDNALGDVPFVSEFNTQWLQVTGLPANSYTLKINGVTIANYTAAALAAGVDLSAQTMTPQYTAAFALREQLYRKQVVDTIKRDLNSTRLNMESYYERDTVGEDPVVHAYLVAQDWDNPADHAQIISYLDRQHQELNAAGRPPSGFFPFISNQTRTHLPNIVALNAELATIRSTVLALPASRTYQYNLTPVSGTTGGGSINYAQWKQSRFTAAQLQNASISGSSSDPEDDGFANLIEYALDTEPLSTDSGGAPALEIDPITQGRVFTFTKWRSDITYRVEVSTTLSQFSAVGIDQQNVDTAPVGTVIRVPLPPGGNLFARLSISEM